MSQAASAKPVPIINLIAEACRKVLANRAALPSMPDVAARIHAAMQSPNLSISTIATIIEGDAGTTTYLLQVANSALYSGVTPIMEPELAVTRLGINSTRNLVMAHALRSMFVTRSDLLGKLMRRTWQTSARLAATSAVLARRCPRFSPERALRAGLLQDIGVLPILNVLKKYQDQLTDEAAVYSAVEKHAPQVGMVLLRQWEFEPELVEVARSRCDWHRDPRTAADMADLVLVARLHDNIVRGTNHGLPKIDEVPAFSKPPLGELRPDSSLECLHEEEASIVEVKRLLVVERRSSVAGRPSQSIPWRQARCCDRRAISLTGRSREMSEILRRYPPRPSLTAVGPGYRVPFKINAFADARLAMLHTRSTRNTAPRQPQPGPKPAPRQPHRILLPVALALTACTPSGQDAASEHRATLARFCFDCHDDVERTADLSLESLDLARVAADVATWEHVVRKLRTGMMPPHDGGPRPARDESAALAAWLESELDLAAAASPDPGRTVPLHRLNRAEYRNAVRDLLAVDVDVADLLPGDDASYGFDNIGGVLKLSPTLLERYLAAADEISRLAVGMPSPFVRVDSFRVPDDRSQEHRLPGLPFGTRGGLVFDYTFPEDAEYLISAELARDLNESMPVYPEPQVLEISIDRQRVATFTLELPAPTADSADTSDADDQAPRRLSRAEREAHNRADENWVARVPVQAGRREVTVTFLGKAGTLVTAKREPFLYPFPRGFNMDEQRTGAYLRRVEISGPYGSTGPGDTASRERIFICRPGAEERRSTPESDDCAGTILAGLARRAFRRPVGRTDLDPLLALYRAGHAEAGGFDGGIQVALKALLVSPEFLFRIERDPPGTPPGTSYRIGDLELASRLSFFLWSSIPDDELLAAAEHGDLREPEELERQVRRMIRDGRADAFVDNFAGQWLFLRNLEAVLPVQKFFPNFDDTLREGLRRETELFFASVLREDRSVLDLLDADYTYVNERVALHYGIPGIKGSHFRRVALPESSPRRGLLGHGSILAVTSLPDRTSPVLRGKWILENLLGADPPAPPANVPPLEDTDVTDGAGRMLSLRDRLAAHRANPTCAACHSLMDSLGFALEGFDAVGRWREIDELGDAIDAAGILPDGGTFDGLDAFREALLDSERFPAVLAEKLLVYALGRGIGPNDMPAVRGIVRAAEADGHRFSRYIVGVVESVPFQMRRTAE